MYLLDTNVVSERSRPQPEQRVIAWLDATPFSLLFISVLTVGELLKGVHALEQRSAGRAVLLRAWVATLRADYVDRTIGIDVAVAEAWGALAAQRPRPVIDGLLAATALVHGLTIVTRNLRELADAGVATFNPWDA